MRTARTPQALRLRRGPGLPPNLLPGITGRRKKGRNLTPWIAGFAAIVGISMVVMLVGFVVTTASAIAGTKAAYDSTTKDLPNAAQITADTFQTTRIYDRNGVLLQEVADPDSGWRTFVPFEQISPYLIQATISAEDATFWSHYGVEPLAIVRGALIISSGEGSSGGSTITQQLARALYPDRVNPLDVSVTRKAREALIAVYLDKEYSKQDLLTMYLNLIFYGQRSFGIEAASQTYFDKHASDLNLAEASLLAGLPQAPSYFDPTVNFEQAKVRQQYVLNQMVKYDYITREEADKAFNEPLTIQKRTSPVYHAPHFTQYVKDWIVEHYGKEALYNSGLTFTTSIDTELQTTAEGIVRNGVANLAADNRNNGAAVGVVPWSGEILFMVGSADFDDPTIGGQVNYATAGLQPGSSIKPLVYAAAFEAGWNPGTVVFDTYLQVDTAGQAPYIPNNYSQNFNGAVSVRIALANSLNIPAVKAARYAGLDHVIDLTRRMGYKNSLTQDASFYGLPLALGSGEVQLVEHTNAYATLANNGAYVPLHPVIKVTDSQGNVLYDVTKDPSVTKPQQALDAGYAYQVSSILTDNQSRSLVFGENNLFGNTQNELGRPTAAKSGTTEDWKDLWTMGYTTDLAVGVWVGNTNAYGDAVGQLSEIDGIQAAGPIWHDLMVELHKNGKWSSLLYGPNGKPMAEAFSQPSDVYKGKVCAATGNRDTPGYTGRDELLVRDSGPALPCDQLSAYQQTQLDDAITDLNEHGDRYTGGAYDSIYRYRDAVQNGSDDGPSDSNSNSDSSSDNGDNQDDSGGDSPPIVQSDGN